MRGAGGKGGAEALCKPAAFGRLLVAMRKKLLVLSDTHGYVAALSSVLSWAKEASPSAAVFLGDGLADLDRATASAGFSCQWHKVRGNNDFGFPHPESAVFDFCGHRFFICHGHRYNLYRGVETLAGAARASSAATALFGHIHVPFHEDNNGLLLVNPGSLGIPRSSLGPTFALIECSPEEPPMPSFWGIDPAGSISAISVGKS